jgi:uncharacterized membrane protein YdjX (TVP38/TMEM64 family)
MLSATPADRKKFLVKLAVAAVALAVVAGVLLRGMDYHRLIDPAMALIRGVGPWTFFIAMALLPAAAVPMLTFSLTAGPVFGERLGLGAVVAAGLAAATFNLLLTYWLARRALRPWLARMLERLGYRLPQLDSADLTDLIVILRVTPGVPFFAQNYLLGLAGVPAGRYLAISCPIVWSYTAGFIVFGDALLHGHGKTIVLAVSLLAAAAAAAHLLRHHYAGRKKTA